MGGGGGGSGEVYNEMKWEVKFSQKWNLTPFIQLGTGKQAFLWYFIGKVTVVPNCFRNSFWLFF